MAQTSVEKAASLLDRLTPEERIGQLFLITFKGNNVTPESDIYILINQYHISGVVLTAANDNFIYDGESPENFVNQISSLNRSLQQVEWSSSLNRQQRSDSPEDFLPSFIPLFIGISQEGDGYPYDQILAGVTTLPNAMSIGATWNPEMARETGEIAGRELSALGFNLYMGPSLDVLEAPQLEIANSLGTRSFGGDPFWVSQMGRAYIQGIHQGSQGKMATVAKHFPGHGSSDRLPEDEVATIRKSLEELKSFDLAPFFSITGLAPSEEETTDALLASHIRYQGLQGNIRATTRPVNLDPQAFELLMQLPELQSWRNAGGVMITDNLGSRAMRRFYELSNQAFDASRVALNAFLAGNDLLYIGDFTSNADPDTFASTTHTLEFFAQKYREDSAFAQKVDQSVLKVLTLKYKLYDLFNLGSVLQPYSDLQAQDEAHQKVLQVARSSATLISPTQLELDEAIPDPPGRTDRLIIISDTRNAQQCTTCPIFPLLDKNSLRASILRLYGPQVGGQIDPNLLYVYSTEELGAFLDNPDEQPSLIARDLQRSNWIIFTLLDRRDQSASYTTLMRFLDEQPALFQQKKLIVFALGAPYYLDATTISKLTAYYVLYSKTAEFIDAVAYLLFQELRPMGTLPISVPGIGYDLNEMLFPDPNRVIQLTLDLPEQITTTSTPGTPIPTPTITFNLQDVLPLRTGIILDHNGHPVPDNTPVRFVFNIEGLSDSIVQETVTTNGIAQTAFTITHPGVIQVYAQSENARSETLQFEVISLPGVEITITETPTSTPTETALPTITPTPTLEAVIKPQAPSTPGIADWIISLLISCLIGISTYQLSMALGNPQWGVRLALVTFMGGIGAYIYLALNLPGSREALEFSVPISIAIGTAIGNTIGLLSGLTWRAVSQSIKK